MPKWLKTTLLLTGAGVFLVVLIAVLSAVFIGVPLDKDSRAAAESMVRAVGAQWDPAVLRAGADDAMLKALKPGQLDALLAVFRARLGSVKSVSDPVGTSNSYFDIAKMTTRVTAHWRMRVGFEKGPGSATVDLVKRDGRWRLFALNINSGLLLKAMEVNNAAAR